MSILVLQIILMGKGELVALLNLSSWCLVMAERLFLTVPRGCLRFVIVVFPDHTHLLFLLLRMRNRKIIVLFLNQNICCVYSKEPSQTVILIAQTYAKHYGYENIYNFTQIFC